VFGTEQAVSWSVANDDHGQTQKSYQKAGTFEDEADVGYEAASFRQLLLLTNDIDTQFTCLFCHHDKSVTVRMDRKEGFAQLVCSVCGQRYQSKVNRALFCPPISSRVLSDLNGQISRSLSTSTLNGSTPQMLLRENHLDELPLRPADLRQ